MRIKGFIGAVGLFCCCSALLAQSPDDVAGLALWLRADQLTADGSQVSWNDLSGNGHDALQGIPASHPTVMSDSPFINNQPYLQFDGTDDHLFVDDAVDVGTVFVVLNYTDPSGVFNSFDGVITGQSGGNDQILFIGSTGSANFFASGFFGSNIRVNGVPSVDFAPTSQWKFIRGSAATPQSFQNLVIGRDRTFPNRSWEGGIAEVIVYSGQLTAAENELVTAYILERYTPEVALEPNYFPDDFCPLELDAGQGFLSYNWQDDSDGQIYPVDDGGSYAVSVLSTFGETLNGGTQVTYPGNFISSFDLCAGQDSLWSTGLDPANYDFEWQDGSEESFLLIDAAGSYQVQVTDQEGCSFLSDQVDVASDEFANQDVLEPTSQLCEGGILSTSITLTSGLEFDWSNGSVDSETVVTESGTVSVSITNQNGCVLNDQTEVEVIGVSPLPGFVLDYECNENELAFTDLSETVDGSSIVSWTWIFPEGEVSDEQNPQHVFPNAGLYNVLLQITTDSGCAAQTEQEVLVPSKVEQDIGISNNCAGYTMVLTNQPTLEYDSILSVDWTVSDQNGDEVSSGVGTDFLLEIDTQGMYFLTYTYQTDSGCVEQIATPIEVLEPGYCFSPDTINSLKFWISADSLVQENGGGVTHWGNIRDTAYNAQTQSASLPVLVEAIPELNSLSAIRVNSNNTWMNFSELSSIRTLVALIKHQSGSQDGFPTLFGHNVETDFVGANGPNLFLPGVAATELFQGVGRVNGEAMEITDMVKPQQYSIHSFVPTDSLVAEFLSKDRNFTNRGWLGDFVEVLMFDEFLTPIELEQVEQYLRYKYAPPVDLPTAIQIPYGFCALDISAHEAFYADYHWSTGSTDSAITVLESGVYTVSVTDIYGYTSTDSVAVTYPAVFPSDPETICLGDTYSYNTGLAQDAYQFSWSTGDTTAAISISDAGEYSLTITDSTGCVYETPALTVAIDSFPLEMNILYLPTFCQGNPLQLLPEGEPILTQNWSTGDTTATIIPDNEGVYWAEAQNINGCIGTDTVEVEFAGIAPVVQYEAGTLCEETEIGFSDESQAPGGATIIGSSWSIDGDMLFGEDVVYTFPEPGNYFFEHQVQTDDGCTGFVEELIYVNPIPQVNFEFSLACSDQTTLFEDQSTIVQGVISDWLWDFGNGNTANTSEASNQFVDPGIADVTLTVESAAGCSASEQLEVPVYPTPQAEFEWSATCEGELMLFESTSDTGLTGPLNYAWNFNGVVGSGITAQHLFSGTGTYVVSHEVWSTIAGIPGCFDESVQEVVVSAPPNVQFTHSVACAGQQFLLTDATTPGENDAVISWQWNASGGTIDTLASATHSFEEVGSYPVTLQVNTEAGCEGVYTDFIEVGFSDSPQITFSPEIGLPPLEVEFVNTNSIGQSHLWQFGDGGESVLESPIHTYTDTGIYAVEVIVFDEAGCFGFDSATVLVIEPYFDVAVESVTCDFQAGKLSVSCVIGNYNNHRLTSAELSMVLGNGTAVSEFWEGDLGKNQLASFTFQSQLNFNPEINDAFVCVEISNPNGALIDMVPENNQMCKSFGEAPFEVFNPFPNPVGEHVSLFVSMDRPSDLTVRLVHSDGKLISEYTRNYDSGLNLIQVNTEALSAGVYLIGIEWKDETVWRKLIIHKN